MKIYQTFEEKEVIELHYNYRQAMSDSKEVWSDDWDVAKVGDGDVMSIHEHMPGGEGDRCYYDIVLTGGKVIRTFNPCKVIYNRLKD